MLPKRYLLKETEEIWSEENKLKKWVLVEKVVIEVLAEENFVKGLSKEIALEISEKLNKVDYRWLVEKVKEYDKLFRHDVIAFITALEEYIGENGRFIHFGLTSSDIIDTANALLLKEISLVILRKLEELKKVLVEKAYLFKDLKQIGRTHGVFAEPITFGFKILNWLWELERNIERFKRAMEEISYGKLSGTVGTYPVLPPKIEEKVMKKLGLKPEKVSTQIVPRDRYAFYLSVLSLIGSFIERVALEIRLLQRSEVQEVFEPFAYGKQRGSSAMPHKRNPILSERLCGMARILRGYLLTSLENIALWHERDISHSSTERLILPDATSLVVYMLDILKRIVEKIEVNEEKMKENIRNARDLYYSQIVLLSLIEKGVSRLMAYKWVQECAFGVGKKYKNLKEAVLCHSKIRDYLSDSEIESLFSYNHLRNIGEIFRRFE